MIEAPGTSKLICDFKTDCGHESFDLKSGEIDSIKHYSLRKKTFLAECIAYGQDPEKLHLVGINVHKKILFILITFYSWCRNVQMPDRL
jgi:hypothetical protein